MKIGAHVSTAGGIHLVPERAAAIGAEAAQIFTSIPQTWRKRKITDEQVRGFIEGMAERGIGPAFIHGIYLVNLATATPEQLVKSEDSLVTDLAAAERIGAEGVIFHVGVFRTPTFDDIAPQIAAAMRRVLDAVPGGARLIIENAAGERKGVGAHFSQIGALIREIGSERVRVCLDTQHAFASGYDQTTRAGVERMMDEFDREIGADRLAAVHANDSKVPCGRGVDRHENIGEGHIGLDGFRQIVAHPALRRVPFLLEVPGFDGNGPDAKNVAILKSLADEAGAR